MNFAKYRVHISTEKRYSSKYEYKYKYEYSIPGPKYILCSIQSTKVHKRMGEQTTIVVSGRKRVKNTFSQYYLHKI